jgi:hypothetical protein
MIKQTPENILKIKKEINDQFINDKFIEVSMLLLELKEFKHIEILIKLDGKEYKDFLGEIK